MLNNMILKINRHTTFDSKHSIYLNKLNTMNCIRLLKKINHITCFMSLNAAKLLQVDKYQYYRRIFTLILTDMQTFNSNK